MLVYGGEGTDAEARGDLFIGRRVTVLLGEGGEKVDDLFLPPRDSHAGIVANKRRIATAILSREFWWLRRSNRLAEFQG